jgi:hypothetical protein
MEDATRLVSGGLKYLMDVLAIELRNLEALALAQQKMIEGLSVLLRHQTEIAGDTLRRAFDAKALAGNPPSGVGATVLAQIAALKTSIVESQANSSTLSEIAARSSGEVANILQARMLAALDELRAALEPVVTAPSQVAPPVLTVQPTPLT